MTKYKIYGNYVFSKCLGEVEAESEEKAIEKALDNANDTVDLCFHCSGYFEDRGYLDEESCTAEIVKDKQKQR